MTVGTIRDKLVTKSLELRLKGLGILDHLLLVLPKFGGRSLLESNRKSGDGVVVGSTLVTREDREVDGTLEIVHDVVARLRVSAADALAEENHGTAGSTQRFVGGSCDNIGVLKRRRDNASGNQARDVSHVDNEVGADLVSDLAHAGVVDQTAVGGGTSNQALGAVELSVGLEGFIVNDTGLKVDAVGEGFEVSRNSGDPAQYG